MTIRRLAVLTSGGDTPGMNSAIRAVVRQAAANEMDVLGVMDGYSGLFSATWGMPLTPRDVAGINALGGTILGSAREPRMLTYEGLGQALRVLRECHVDGLIVIGGNGSQAGAKALSATMPVVGIASTIDNDLGMADTSIGVATAVQTIVESIDRLKCTATSHRRMVVVETMGRASGYLAFQAALAAGAERVVVPEVPDSETDILRAADYALHIRGKRHYVLVVAEGATFVNGEHLVATAREQGIDARFTRLGHVQRGGVPVAADRALGARLGELAVRAMAYGDDGGVVMPVRGELRLVYFDDALDTERMRKVTLDDVLLVQDLA